MGANRPTPAMNSPSLAGFGHWRPRRGPREADDEMGDGGGEWARGSTNPRNAKWGTK